MQTNDRTVIWDRYTDRFYGHVLELGPYNGRDTVYLGLCCNEITCIEARQANADETMRAVEGKPYGVHMIVANLEDYDLTRLGAFDCVWAAGILYHLPRPWTLIRQITQVTDLCYGWTHLAEKDKGEREGYRGYQFLECDSPLAGVSVDSWWLLPSEFQRVWRELGWSCELLTPPEPNPNGGIAAQFESRKL